MVPPRDVERALGEPAGSVADELLAVNEDQWFDRKSSRIKPRALADALVAFANADGGVIVIGLSDGRVEGTDAIGSARNELVQVAFDFCVPPVHAEHRLVACVNETANPDHLLVLDVRPTEGAVHANRRGEVFLRVGDENRRLTFAQRQELTFDRGPATYEARTLAGALRARFDEELLDRYVAAIGAADPERLLRARGLVTDDGTPNIAGWLLFGEHPQALLPEAHVRVLRYKGTERGTGASQRLITDVRCEGPIPRMLVEARGHVRELQPMRRALGGEGRFEDIALVPEDAWLEGLVNAVVHRSYSLAGDHVRVEIFDDRIEISSPGRFPGIVDLADPLTAPRFARNPRIARVCADLKFGQELGEGIRRIYAEMRHAGLIDPAYSQTAASVRLLLSAEPADRRLDAQLTPQARKVTAALREGGRLSTGEVAELLQRSRPAAIRVLKALEAAELIRWVGNSPQDPRAYWEIVRR
jgi:ATP-dependent DNA helicase RecG